MAEVTINMPDGTQATGIIPEFALESTQDQMLKMWKKLNPEIFKAIEKEAKEATKQVKEQIKNEKASQKEADKAGQELLKALDGIEAKFQLDADALDRYNKRLAFTEKALNGMYTATVAVSTALIGIATTALTAFYRGFTDVGNTLNELTDVGVGMQDVAGSGRVATQVLAGLSAQGLNAAKTMEGMATIFASQGYKATEQLVAGFLDATESGAALGMSIEQATGMYAEELKARQQIGALDTQTAAGRSKLNQQVQTSITRQTSYARALGVSRDVLADFAQSLMTQTPVLTATLLRFGNDVRGSVTAGIMDFASAMRGLGGEEGGQIAAAFTEAASMGALGFSDAMVGYVRAVPSLAGPMNDYINAVQRGTLSQDQANEMAQSITTNLGNLSAAEKNRVFALARAGDQQAQSMAKAISQFEQTESKLKEINKGFTMEGVQKGSNLLQTMLKQLIGMFDALKYSFFTGVGQSQDLTKAFENAKKIITEAIGKVFGVGGSVGDVNNSMQDIGKTIADKLPKFIEMLATGIATFIENIPSYIETIKGAVSGLMTFLKVTGFLIKAFTALAAIVLVTKGFHALVAGLGAVKNGLSGFAGGLKDAVKGGLKGLFGKDGPINKIGGGGKAVGAATGDGVGIPGGAKSGGILKKIADAVAKFGDNKVVKGAATIALLGTAVLAASYGFAKFGDVSWSGFFKGVAGLGALAVVAKLMAKGSKDMMMGAAAIAILGVALIPAAVGFRLFGDVKWEAIAVGATGLLALGAVGLVLGKALSGLIQGSIAIGLLGVALIPFAFSLNLMKDFGWDNFTAFAASLGVLSVAAIGLGFALPFIAAGAAAITLLGLALIPFAFAMKMAGEAMPYLMTGLSFINMVDTGAWLELGTAMLAFGAAVGIVALTSPLLIVFAGAVALLGLAMTPLAAGLDIVAASLPAFTDALFELTFIDYTSLLGLAGSFAVLGAGFAVLALGLLPIMALNPTKDTFAFLEDMSNGLKTLSGLPLKEIALVGPALLSLAAGLAGLSAGNLISNVLDGLGSLFGGKSPFEKLAEIGKVAPDINKMVDSLKQMPDAVGKFNEAAGNIDGQKIKDQWTIASDGIWLMVTAVDNLSSALDMLTPEQLKVLSGSGRTMATAQKQDAPEKTFGETFKEARSIQGGAGGVFEYNGKDYQTNIVGEAYVKDPSRVTLPTAPTAPVQPQLVAATDTGGSVADPATGTTQAVSPDKGSQSSVELLTALLNETKAQNKLLKRQVQGTQDIASQV